MASPQANPREALPLAFRTEDGPDGRALLAASTVPSFLCAYDGEDGPIVFVNEALLALTGLEADDLLGRNRSILHGFRDGEEPLAPLAQDLGATEAPALEFLGRRKDGSSYIGELSLAPVPDAEGRIAWRLGQIVDVTRRADAESAIALSQRREALGLLTNSVAHEFNNFLQILIGYIDSLKRRLGDRPEPMIQRALTRSTEAAERAAVLTRQLLAYSRRIAPEVRPVDLDRLVAAAADRLRPTLPARARLTVTPSQGLPAALCNPMQVEVALRYILANAVEAMEAGGEIAIATFAIAPGDRTLMRPGDGAVGLTVTDQGHGMSPEMVARALVPFATSHEAGRGVGLAIVHGLMKRQNGTISFESRPGEGTSVRLVFPAAP